VAINDALSTVDISTDTKELAKLVKDRDFMDKKLKNPAFVERAPAEVLDKDRARLAELNAAIDKVDLALARLGPKK